MCPRCGFMSEKTSHNVIMEDGTLQTFEGPIISVKKTHEHDDDFYKSWYRFYWGYKNKRHAQTFHQMAAAFVRLTGHPWPPIGTPFTPRDREDWQRYVYAVSPHLLYWPKRSTGRRKQRTT